MRNEYEIFIVTLESHVHSTIKISQYDLAPNIGYEKDNYNQSLCTINHKSIFAAKFLTKTCHIMIPQGRDFDKDSKKSLFDILGFFYDF